MEDCCACARAETWRLEPRTQNVRGPKGGRPKILLFFPLPPQISLFLLSRGSSRGIVAAVQGRDPPKVHVRAPWGHFVRAPASASNASSLRRPGASNASNASTVRRLVASNASTLRRLNRLKRLDSESPRRHKVKSLKCHQTQPNFVATAARPSCHLSQKFQS